jgi:predicted protein tyrosine phosphatase
VVTLGPNSVFTTGINSNTAPVARVSEPGFVCPAVAIGDPLAAPAQLSDRFAAVLRLSFHDITAHPSPDDILFAEEHAEQILRFVQQWSGVDRIVVHCLAGVSRSPGTALGLCDVLGWPAAELERRHPAFNRRVRTVIAKCGATSARPDG